ncbi:MAG TPA: DNA-processing protein DprA [Sphingomonas sp.]|nr:DNA-processing protein DprA [Sphingomonas sp.]
MNPDSDARTVDAAVARLRLLRTPGIGPVTYRELLVRYASAEAAIVALPMLAARGGGAPPRIATVDAVEREMAATARHGARYLFIDDPAYPRLLAAIDAAPPALILRGNLALATRACIALVGARNASAAAIRFARQLGHDLAPHATIVSGLARGIDTAAHLGAMPATIGVIAGGIDVAYPPENAALQERIAADGLLVAEQPPGTEPRARHFPYRNRIIAGLSLGTVVVEAVPRSGSLITARLAAEMGREVMAVPGSPLDPRAQGCNQLIRDGATLVQSAADILDQVRPIDPRAVRSPVMRFASGPAPIAADASDGERRVIFALLGAVPVAVDELVRQTGCPPAIVQTVLLELELAGRVERHAGNRVSRA